MFERHLPYLLKFFNVSPQQKDGYFFTNIPHILRDILMRQKMYLCVI